MNICNFHFPEIHDLQSFLHLVHGTDIGRQIQIFGVPCLILYLDCCHDFIGCKVFRECLSVIYLLHFEAMLHKNSIGQDFHPAFLESLFRKLYKVCLLLFLFWHGYEFIQIETLSYLLYIRKICNQRKSLHAEGQIDQILHRSHTVVSDIGIQYLAFILRETIHPFSEKIYLIHVHGLPLEFTKGIILL